MPEYKVKFDAQFDKVLRETAKSDTKAPQANTKEEVIQRAVALYVYLHNQIDNTNLKVAIVDPDATPPKIHTIITSLP